MSTFESFSAAPPSWLAFIGTGRVAIPEALRREVDGLKSAIKDAFKGEYESLEAALVEMLPAIWTIKLHALPLLAKIDIGTLMKFAHAEFSQIVIKYPPLSAAAEKLAFGLDLMAGLTAKLAHENPELLKSMDWELLQTEIPSLSEIMAQLDAEGSEAKKVAELIHVSLMMELLLLAVDIAADENLPLDAGICYELDYQSAVTVKAYAAAFGLAEEQMPWYQSPENDLERLLLSGPVLEESEIAYMGLPAGNQQS